MCSLHKLLFKFSSILKEEREKKTRKNQQKILKYIRQKATEQKSIDMFTFYGKMKDDIYMPNIAIVN